MKIESKHGTKKPEYAAAVATMLAATTLVSGCGLQYSGGLTESTPYSSEVELDGDVVCPTDETIALPSREYFEKLNKDYTIDNIIGEIGYYNDEYGHGITQYEWNLENGEKAILYFDGDRKLSLISIVADNSEKIIYDRYEESTPYLVVENFFDSFILPNYENMKQYCTEEFQKAYFHDYDVYGIANINGMSLEHGQLYGDKWRFYATLYYVDSFLGEETTKSIYVVLVKNENGDWLIDEFSPVP